MNLNDWLVWYIGSDEIIDYLLSSPIKLEKPLHETLIWPKLFAKATKKSDNVQKGG